MENNSFLYPMIVKNKVWPYDPSKYLYCYAHQGIEIVINTGRIFNASGVELTENLNVDLRQYHLPRYPSQGVLTPDGRIVLHDVILHGSSLWERQEFLNSIQTDVQKIIKCPIKVAMHYDLCTWPAVNEFIARGKGLGCAGLWMKKKGSQYWTSRKAPISTKDWYLLTEEVNDG